MTAELTGRDLDIVVLTHLALDRQALLALAVNTAPDAQPETGEVSGSHEDLGLRCGFSGDYLAVGA